MIFPKDLFDVSKVKKYSVDENWNYIVNIMWVIWYTNLDISKRHENMILYKNYNEKEFPKYDNYDAINVNKVVEIPKDYDWIIWVPITFIDSYNPEQFEIIASDYQIKEWLYPNIIKKGWKWKIDRWYINWERIYARILIRRKK